MIDQLDAVPSPTSALLLQQLGIAANRMAPGATAFDHGDARCNGLVLASWDAPGDDAAHIDWSRHAWRSSRTFSTGHVYGNGVAVGDSEEIDGAYGVRLGRLSALESVYDAPNVFLKPQHAHQVGVRAAPAEGSGVRGG